MRVASRLEEEEVNPKRTRTPAKDAGRRDASERVDPGSHPCDSTKVPGRPQGASHDSDRAAERCPARFPSGTRSGVTYSTSSAAVEISPTDGNPPRLATTGSDVPRDPPTQVLVVVKDEARHAPIKKLLQEIGYKGARQAQPPPASSRATMKRDFFLLSQTVHDPSELGLLPGRSFLVDPPALSRRGTRAARKSRGIAPRTVSGRCTRRIDSTRARR